jgi:hypothetical protein
MACPFCARIETGEVAAANALAVAFADAFPLTPGHTLVVSRRHEPDFLALDPAEQQAVLALGPRPSSSGASSRRRAKRHATLWEGPRGVSLMPAPFGRRMPARRVSATGAGPRVGHCAVLLRAVAGPGLRPGAYQMGACETGMDAIASWLTNGATGWGMQHARRTAPDTDAAPLVRRPPSRRRPRHPHRPGMAGPPRRQHHDDLHGRPQPGAGRRQEPRRPPGLAMNRTRGDIRGDPTPIDCGVSRRTRDLAPPPARKPLVVHCPFRPPPGRWAGYTRTCAIVSPSSR